MTSPLPAQPAPSLSGGLDLPYLVYGTLRAGGSNVHRALRHGARHGGRLSIAGFAMVESPAGYPYLVPERSAPDVVAEVIEPPADAAAQRALRADLDDLEGYVGDGERNHYDRVAFAFVEPDTGASRWGWLYVAAPTTDVDGLPRIESGDWFRREG